MADLDIDPASLRRFAAAASNHVQPLKTLSSTLNLSADALGHFHEATDLVAQLNKQSAVVQHRCSNAAQALESLVHAAQLAAQLAATSDAQSAQTMQQISNALDAAHRHVQVPAQAGAPRL